MVVTDADPQDDPSNLVTGGFTVYVSVASATRVPAPLLAANDGDKGTGTLGSTGANPAACMRQAQPTILGI